MPITLRLTPANGQEAAARRELTDFVERTSGQTLAACYQCAKCAAGCPLAAAMDLAPQQIIRALQLGQPDLALPSQTLWLCVGCQTCATRCPCNVELPRIMDALRLWAETRGRSASMMRGSSTLQGQRVAQVWQPTHNQSV